MLLVVTFGVIPAVVVVRVPYNPSLERFWHQRRELFSRYDRGVWLDAEGWYSVTPEAVAVETSKVLAGSRRNTLFVDAFVGVGGNAIQQALLDPCGLVIAIDLDADKVNMARHNVRLQTPNTLQSRP